MQPVNKTTYFHVNIFCSVKRPHNYFCFNCSVPSQWQSAEDQRALCETSLFLVELLWDQIPKCLFYIVYCRTIDLSILFTLQSKYTGACCCWCALFDVCAQFNKALSLKPGGGWLIFFPVVSGVPRWRPQSDTVHIALFVQVGSILCLSRIIKIYMFVYLLGLFE